jgi:hypothetical protein
MDVYCHSKQSVYREEEHVSKWLYTTRHLSYGVSGPNRLSIRDGEGIRKELIGIKSFWRGLHGHPG